MDNQFHALDILKFFIKHYKPISLITIFGAIVSIIVSLLIEPEYQSTAIIFPASNTSVSKELLTDISRSNKNILQFGEDEEAEQVLQILQSNKIKTFLVKKYKLIEHYELQDAAYPQTALSRMLAKNISFDRTRYQSIEISVLDKDKKMAAAMVTDILQLLDTVYNQIQKKRALGALQIVEKEYKRMDILKKTLQDSLNKIRLLGVYDYEAQSKAYSVAMANAIERGNISVQKKIKSDIEILQKFGGAFTDITGRLQNINEQMGLLEAKLSEARVDYEQNLSHKFIVNPPFVPEKKAKPVRWLIVLLSTAGSFIVATFLLIFWEQWNQIKDTL